MIPELTPWGQTSGSKNPGKPLICSATWTRFLQDWNCLCWIKLDGRGWGRSSVALAQIPVLRRGWSYLLIWSNPEFLAVAKCPERGNLPSTGRVKIVCQILPGWVAILGGKGGFCSALVQYQLHTALGAAGRRLANNKHLFSLFYWVLCFIRETWNWPVTSKYLLSSSPALSIYLGFIFSAFLIVQFCFLQSVIHPRPRGHV